MRKVLYTTSREVYEGLQFLSHAFELRTREELITPLQAQQTIIIGGNGYRHHDAIDLVKAVNMPITYVHIDAHSDRLGLPPEQIYDYFNFTFGISALPNVAEIIYLGVDTRQVVTSSALQDLLMHCRVYGNGLCSSFYKEVFQGHEDLEDVALFDREAAARAFRTIGVMPHLYPELERAIAKNGSVSSYRVRPSSLISRACLMLFFKRISEFDPNSIKTEGVYISIDVDVIKPEEGIPIGDDFSTGSLSVEALANLLSSISRHKRIVATDIHGIDLKEVPKSESVQHLLEKVAYSLS